MHQQSQNSTIQKNNNVTSPNLVLAVGNSKSNNLNPKPQRIIQACTTKGDDSDSRLLGGSSASQLCDGRTISACCRSTSQQYDFVRCLLMVERFLKLHVLADGHGSYVTLRALPDA